MLTALHQALALGRDARQDLAEDTDLALVSFWAVAGLAVAAAFFLTNGVPADVLPYLG